jgi:hypothetical protein
MKPKLTAIERAFELAGSGKVTTVEAIRLQSKREGYEQGGLVGKALVSQLRRIIARALKQPLD